ncbi:hypothetical protein [Streptomyces sp. NPDC050485]|uniref:hypothetical protein n=1 Tax=Streptomyces sp. NPDC050485 TaxID=3365617 RepID=UPI0037AE71BF
MPNRDEQGLATSRPHPQAPAPGAPGAPGDAVLQLNQLNQLRQTHPAFDRFLRSVDAEVETRITDDELEHRLRQIKQTLGAHEAPPPPPRVHELATRAEWAAYGYHVVRLWLTAIATATGRRSTALQTVALGRDDIDPLAVETVARAVNSFRDRTVRPDRLPEPEAAGPEPRAEFLTECVRHLPYAQRSRRLMGEHIPYDEFEDADEVEIVQALYGCVAPGRADALRRVAGREDWPGQTEEVITLTPIAIRAAAQRYPEAVDPTSMP